MSSALSSPLLTPSGGSVDSSKSWRAKSQILLTLFFGVLGLIFLHHFRHSSIDESAEFLSASSPLRLLKHRRHSPIDLPNLRSFNLTSGDDIDELIDEVESIGFEVMHKSPLGWQAGLSLHRPRVCEDPSSGVKQYSGYLTINSTDFKSFFFWFVEARHDPLTAPTALWFSGGPGASSMFALLGENGPCWVLNKTEDGFPKVEKNPFSWTESANMLWIDQPSGTGFSIGTNSVVGSEKQVADDMYLLLQAFLLQFPQYGNSIYLVGESFGGHYVTAIAHKIVEMNKELAEAGPEAADPADPEKEQNVVVPLKGIAIGNGMTDTLEQVKWYPRMAFNSTTAPAVINESTYVQMEEMLPAVIQAIRACAQSDDLHECTQAYEAYSDLLMLPVSLSGANVYDLRLKGNYDFSAMDAFLNDPRVINQIGAKKEWVGVNVTVWQQLAPVDFLHSFQALIPPILDQGIKVLIYAGDQDYICNWLGVNAWTEKLDWSGHDEFNAMSPTEWIGGKTRFYKNFAFATIADSGHMAPMDQPENSLRLFNALLAEGDFDINHFDKDAVL